MLAIDQQRILGLLGALLASTALLSCAAPERRQPDHIALDSKGVAIGEFELDDDAILDGDTIRVKGMESTLRLIGVDTEETFKKERERRAFALGWELYLREMRGDSRTPVKMATPLGEAAKKFAEQFFAGARKVRLERDRPDEVRDRYGRMLSYVFVERGGAWVNYNVECVRAGMSPYFPKYGYARRYHSAFIAAQEEARAAGRGIWDPTQMHYPDYDERLRWWTARAEFIQAFEQEAAALQVHEGFMQLTSSDAPAWLQRHVGREVQLLGSASGITRVPNGPTLVMLGLSGGEPLPLVFFAPEVLAASLLEQRTDELVRVRGEVSVYKSKRTGKEQLQIVVHDARQIVLSETVPVTGAGVARPETADDDEL